MIEISEFLPLLVAWGMDICLGDPMGIPHPIVGFGKLISKGEKLLNKGKYRKWKSYLKNEDNKFIEKRCSNGFRLYVHFL